MPHIQYQEKKLRKSSLEIIDQANTIIADYQAQGLVLTLRQLYYRFVAADLLPNQQKEYKRLGSIIADGRLNGMIDWNAIEDRARNLHQYETWDDPSEIISDAEGWWLTDLWSSQPKRVEVWVEKQALESVIAKAARPYNVPYLACKGYMSISEMWTAAQRFEQYDNTGQQPIIIHLGDHDPSGIDMTRDIRERINDVFDVELEVIRIALNMDQIEEYQPPPNPAKMTDSRFAGYQAAHGDDSWELDALEPATLNELIRHHIEANLDQDLWDEAKEKQEEQREMLSACSDRWEDVVEYLKHN